MKLNILGGMRVDLGFGFEECVYRREDKRPSPLKQTESLHTFRGGLSNESSFPLLNFFLRRDAD